MSTKRATEEAIPHTPRARTKRDVVDWDLFLDCLREIPDVKRACRRVGVNRRSAYERRASHPAFAAAWKDAIEDAVDTLMGEGWKRALLGWKPTDVTRDRPSDDLLKFYLRCHRPEVYAHSIRVQSQMSLAELRVMSDDELNALAVSAGLMKE